MKLRMVMPSYYLNGQENQMARSYAVKGMAWGRKAKSSGGPKGKQHKKRVFYENPVGDRRGNARCACHYSLPCASKA
jgi:hypothetical protein